jgi:hypothetical protein
VICEKFQIPAEDIVFDPSKPKGQFRKPAKSDLPQFNFTPFKDGISETVDWLINNYNTARI